MEGSIADSVSLRMRSGLQRIHHASSSNDCSTGSDGFLEELLKMPAVQSTIEDDQAAISEAPAEQPLPTSDNTSLRADSGDVKEEAKEAKDADESSSDPLSPCVIVCYAPTAVAQPAEAAPVDDESLQPVSATVGEPVSSTVKVEPADAAPAQVQVVENEVSEVVVAPTTTAASDELVAPVDVEAPQVATEAPAANLREVRRPKDVRTNADATGQVKPQAVEQSSTRPIPKTDDAKSLEQPADREEAVQPVEHQEFAQPVAQSDAPRSRDDDSGKHEKWYESRSASDNAQTESLVDQLQADAADDSERSEVKLTDPVSVSNTDSSVNAAVAALSSEVIQPSSIETAQLASDMTASVQASAAQSLAATTVTESSSATNVDQTSRRATPITSPVAGVTSGLRSGASTVAKSATATNQPDEDREVTQQERVRLVQRVARSFNRLGPDGGQVTLKLHPPQLGVLNVSIKMEGQTMTARLQTETAAARDVIVDNLPVLRDRLSEQGIEVEKFQVEVGQQEDFASSSGQSGASFGNSHSSGQSESNRATEFDYRRSQRVNAVRQATIPAPVTDSGLQSWNNLDRTLDVRA